MQIHNPHPFNSSVGAFFFFRFIFLFWHRMAWEMFLSKYPLCFFSKNIISNLCSCPVYSCHTCSTIDDFPSFLKLNADLCWSKCLHANWHASPMYISSQQQHFKPHTKPRSRSTGLLSYSPTAKNLAPRICTNVMRQFT